MVFLPYSRFGNENFFGSLDFSPTIGKDDADSEVVSKQVAAVADVTFTLIRDIWESGNIFSL